MTETEEIDKLLEISRNAYLHEKDAKLTKKLRIGALDDAFMCQMIGACEKYYTLMKEMLDYPRRDNLAGTAAFFRRSWWHNVYLELANHFSSGIGFTLYRRTENGWAYFSSCVICPDGDKFALYTPEYNGKLIPYRTSCRETAYKNMKYFVKHYKDEWLYKAVSKELRKRIEEKEFQNYLHLDRVT
jgi:hypothetical protein